MYLLFTTVTNNVVNNITNWKILTKATNNDWKVCIKGEFSLKEFFHFLINRNQTRKFGSILVSLVWLPGKKRKWRNINKIFENIAGSVFALRENIFDCEACPRPGFCRYNFHFWRLEMEAICFFLSDPPPRPGGARLWLSVRPEEYSDPSTSTSTSSLPPSLPPSLSLSLSLPCKFNFPNIDNFVPYFS